MQMMATPFLAQFCPHPKSLCRAEGKTLKIPAPLFSLGEGLGVRSSPYGDMTG